MTVSELYRCDLTTKGLVDYWVTERRCPLPLVDRLLELDQSAAADAALWAATEKERKSQYTFPPVEVCGPYPCYYSNFYYWVSVVSGYEDGDGVHTAYYLPEGRTPYTDGARRFKAAADAILWLLDHWQPEGQRVAAIDGSEYTTSGGGRR